MAKKTNINELARRYTTAAFELAKSENALEQVGADLQALSDGLLSDAKTTKLFSSPLLTGAKQVELIKKAAAELKLNSVTKNFLLVVAQNRRLGNLKQIIAAFQQKIAEEKGEVTAQVTAADELDAAQVKQIASDLGKKLGKEVVVKQNVDKSIIGGLIIKIGSVMYDYSIRTKLNRLAEQMKKAS